MIPSWRDQVIVANTAPTMVAGVHEMNKLVTNCCPQLPRTWRTLWFRPRQHRFEDFTASLTTSTNATLDRCAKCGLVVLTID